MEHPKVSSPHGCSACGSTTRDTALWRQRRWCSVCLVHGLYDSRYAELTTLLDTAVTPQQRKLIAAQRERLNREARKRMG